MQSLKFLGNGSGFSKTHNNAFFETKDEFIIIDCSMLNIHKLLELKPYDKETFLFVTHMHDDHVSGIPLLCQYYFYVYKRKLNIIVPKNIYEDMKQELNIKGIDSNIYNLFDTKQLNKEWFLDCIATSHAPELENKCFGYIFFIKDKKCVYTGDTNTLEPFKEYINTCEELYIDVSASYGRVHLKYEDIKEDLLKISNEKEIYLMHIDDEIKMNQLIQNTKIKIVKSIKIK